MSLRKLLVVPCALLLGGCASLIHGSYDTITVNSLEPGTRILVDGVPRGTDTATVQVKRGEPHVIRAEKPGYEPLVVETGDAFDTTSLLGIFIDLGIVSIPIDMISGAAWKTQPLLYTVTPMATGAATAATGRGAGADSTLGFAAQGAPPRR